MRKVVLLLIIGVYMVAKIGSGLSETSRRKITEEVVRNIPAEIQSVLDLAYDELTQTNGKNLKTKNKYTEWRNSYEFEWCGGYVTWCMLQEGIPQNEKNKTPREEVQGLVHVKEAGVGKMYDGYLRMNRVTDIPQKGFIVVFGNANSRHVKTGSTPYYHVGLVYELERLENGKYRITTIEGNVGLDYKNADGSRTKAAHTIRMYTRDYDPCAENRRENLSLVPDEERTEEESVLFSYEYTYNNPSLYITCFLMPWIPLQGETEK